MSIFDTRTWDHPLRLETPEARGIAFDPSGPRLLTVTTLGEATIWDIPAGTRAQHLLEAAGPLVAASFSPDGTLVAMTGVGSQESGILWVFEAKTARRVARFENRTIFGLFIDFDRASKRLAVGTADGKVVVADIAAGVAVTYLEGARSIMRSVCFDPTGQAIVASSWDGVAFVWESVSPYHQWSSKPIGHDCTIGVRPSDDHRVMAVSCSEHYTMIWDVARGESLAQLPASRKVDGEFSPPVAAVSTPSDLVAVPLGSLVGLYHLPDGTRIGTVHHDAMVTMVAFAQHGNALVSASRDGAVLLTEPGRATIALPFTGTDAIDAVAFVADRRIAVADAGGRLRVYDRDVGAVVTTLALPGRMRALRPSEDGRRLITIRESERPGPALLWDLEHRSLIASLGDDKDIVFSARFQDDGRQILTASNPGVARLWDAVTGRLRQSYVGSTSPLFDAVTSPDGSMVVTAGGDSSVRFWDKLSGALLWTLRAHPRPVSSAHFEGDDLITRDFVGSVARWKLPQLPSPAVLAAVLRCLPLRFDEATGTLVEQAPCVRGGSMPAE